MKPKNQIKVTREFLRESREEVTAKEYTDVLRVLSDCGFTPDLIRTIHSVSLHGYELIAAEYTYNVTAGQLHAIKILIGADAAELVVFDANA